MSTETFTPDQVADMFQIKRQQVLRLSASGAWPHHKFGKFTRFTEDDIAKIEEITQRAEVVPATNLYGRKS